MAIDREHGVQVVTVGELLAEDLRIPPYQRPYSWTPETALQLLVDLDESARSTELTDTGTDDRATPYVLGSTIIHRDRATGELHIVDGQQRLLTLVMLLDLLDHAAREESTGKDAPASAAGRTSGMPSTVTAAAPSSASADAVVRPASAEATSGPAEDPQAPVVLARHALRRQVRKLANPSALADHIRTRCTLIRVETDDQDEAFRVFDSQNYRGKSLLPHDILKAYHLRHMHAESSAMKAALVEAWESVDEEEIDRLFSTYLWRIKRWSRGLSALPRFSAHDVSDFKGLTSTSTQTPSGRYHLVAQTAMPLLSLSSVQASGLSPAYQSSRFQIDAPVVAGGPFVEMVSFMLGEIRRLRCTAYAEIWDAFASTRRDDFSEISPSARYRYVSELYLAALIYYTNRFGEFDLDEVRKRLFSWAYTLRVKYQRVQFATVNGCAAQTKPYLSPFVLLRNTDNPAELRHLKIPPEVEGRRQDPAFEAPLVRLLGELGE